MHVNAVTANIIFRSFKKFCLYFLLIFFNWSIIASQCCVSFFCATKWISYLCMYIPSLVSLPVTHSPIPPLQVITKHRAEFPEIDSSSPLALFSPWSCTYVDAPLPVWPTLPFPAVPTSPFSTSGLYTCPARKFICTIFPHMCINIQIYFSFSDLLHSVWQTSTRNSLLGQTFCVDLILEEELILSFCVYLIGILCTIWLEVNLVQYKQRELAAKVEPRKV